MARNPHIPTWEDWLAGAAAIALAFLLVALLGMMDPQPWP